jgi:Transcriptional regulatory protein, C terminal
MDMAKVFNAGAETRPKCSTCCSSGGDRRRHGTGKPPHLWTVPSRCDAGPPVAGAQVALRRRSLAMLRYLAEHPGGLVTKAGLRQHVWAGTHVTDTVLRVCVQEIWAVVADAADTPHYLTTVGRQGDRFLVGDDREVSPPLLAGPLAGRQGEVDTLESWFQRAAQGAASSFLSEEKLG